MNEAEIDQFMSALKEKLYNIHKSYGELDSYVMDGCTDAEIEEVMKVQNVTFLPPLYRRFLSEMGNGRPYVFPGSDYVCNALKVLKLWLISFIKDENIAYKLSEDAFVFLEHGGYVYYFFHTNDENHNPPVFILLQGTDDASICCDSLSEFILNLGMY